MEPEGSVSLGLARAFLGRKVKVKKKISPQYFEAVASGKKKCELRLIYELFWPKEEVLEKGIQIFSLG